MLLFDALFTGMVGTAATSAAATSEVLKPSGEFDSGALRFNAAERIAVRATPSHVLAIGDVSTRHGAAV